MRITTKQNKIVRKGKAKKHMEIRIFKTYVLKVFKLTKKWQNSLQTLKNLYDKFSKHGKNL